MAFTGNPVVKQVADNLVRITGVSLAAEGAAGTIGLFEKLVAAGVVLPAGFKPRTYDLPDAAADVSLQDSIQVAITFTNAGAVYEAISVVKTGTTPQDFVITLTNNAAVEGGDSGALEIYVRFH
jgi:hypothetical protein